MSGTRRCLPSWAVLAMTLAAVALATRPLFPIDETRYAAVAWEMWLRGEFLVPHLNGEPYSHKPPLLFWLVHAGWWLFGVNEWWPRVLPALFGLGGLFLSGRLGAALWPDHPGAARLAPLILSGSLLWALFSTLLFFDIVLAFFALLGVSGVWLAWHGRPLAGWGLTALAIGLGILAKGPVILLHLLPVALLAPWWGRDGGPGWGRWYAGVLAAVLTGAALALVWAVPAARHGGAAYADAIFWGQTAGRMVESFAHQRPWWWYLPLLPLLLFPWLFWPRLWRALGAARRERLDRGMRFSLAWALPALLGFSVISGKQPHYLLPLVPAFALLAARLLGGSGPRRWDGVPLAAILLGGAAAVALLPVLVPDWPGGTAVPLAGAALLATAGAVVLRGGTRHPVQSSAFGLAGAATAALVALHLAWLPLSRSAFDLHGVAAYLAQQRHLGRPIAHLGEYHGQYQFLGRLREPLRLLDKAGAAPWLARHPDGLLVLYLEKDQPLPDGLATAWRQPYRGHRLLLLDAEAARELPREALAALLRAAR